MDFSGKVALITGASSGIGADAARHLAKLGAGVAVVGRNAQRVNEVAEQITKLNSSPKVLPIVADVTVDAERIINETIKHFGRLDILVNNAGISIPDSIVNFEMDKFERILNTNLKSAIVLTHLAVPHLEKTRGNVINVSSVAGLRALDAFTSYCISKAALDQFTKCAALALGPKGIRVNSVNPAMIRTPIFVTLGITGAMAEQLFEERKADYLVGRIGEVSDTSAAIAYLANETFITGILLPIDGGLLTSGVRNDFQKDFEKGTAN